jgi:hypothetical protein
MNGAAPLLSMREWVKLHPQINLVLEERAPARVGGSLEPAPAD